MWGQSSSNRIPEKYRISLALSTAFLAHTLIFAGLPSPILDTEEPRHSIQFELIFPSNHASSSATSEVSQNTTKETTQSRNPTFEIPPAPVAQPSLPQTTVAPSERKVATTKPIPEPKSKSIDTTTKSSVPITSSNAGNKAVRRTETQSAHQATASETRTEEQPTRITQSPSEQDPYLIKLAIHLGGELEKLRVPAIGQLSKKVTMEIELQLLASGALTRTRILKSTGIKGIDDAAYRASLAASPYPKPPENSDQNRFEVELVFSPKRL